MPEWLVEQGIGEDRAVLLDRGEVRAARLQRHGGLVPGLVADARLISRQTGSRRGTLRFESGEEALVDGLRPDASEGTMLRAVVTRSAIAEIGRHKRALAKPTPAAQCRRFLTGGPMDLTEDEVLLELDATGSYGR